VSPALYTLGFVISTSVLHVFGMIIGEVATMQSWLSRGLRFTGAAVTASGVAFLLQSFSGTA
jgi:urease accessory protein